jgi:hypothetical protein
MIIHRFLFTEIHDAMALIENPGIYNGKVVLLFNE